MKGEVTVTSFVEHPVDSHLSGKSQENLND